METLPAEIIAHITTFLDYMDIVTLCITCKDMQSQLQSVASKLKKNIIARTSNEIVEFHSKMEYFHMQKNTDRLMEDYTQNVTMKLKKYPKLVYSIDLNNEHMKKTIIKNFEYLMSGNTPVFRNASSYDSFILSVLYTLYH